MLSNEITNKTQQGSYIRKVFELGIERAAIVGSENIYDFSIGNPIYEPPQEVIDAILKYAQEPGIHRYMPNAGHIDVRQKIASHYHNKTGLDLNENNVIMTSGAAGALNIALKAILNKDDEVIIITPYFPEYPYYAENFLGKAIIVESDEECQVDINNIKEAITNKTKAIIINTPNNPSGIIYESETLEALNKLLLTYKQSIYVILDEPYDQITYDGYVNPNTLKIFKNAIYCNSFSKSLNLPGERVGYVVVSSTCNEVKQLIANIVFCNRTLGFCNANSLFQKVIMDCLELEVDTSKYQLNQRTLKEYFTKIGYDFIHPQGGFYLYLKVPDTFKDDEVFTEVLLENNVIVVPGIAFGKAGYVRISYCCDITLINKLIKEDVFSKIL